MGQGFTRGFLEAGPLSLAGKQMPDLRTLSLIPLLALLLAVKELLLWEATAYVNGLTRKDRAISLVRIDKARSLSAYCGECRPNGRELLWTRLWRGSG